MLQLLPAPASSQPPNLRADRMDPEAPGPRQVRTPSAGSRDVRRSPDAEAGDGSSGRPALGMSVHRAAESVPIVEPSTRWKAWVRRAALPWGATPLSPPAEMLGEGASTGDGE